MINLNELIITKVYDAFTVNSHEKRIETIHNRPMYGLSFCLSGKITYTHMGQEYVSEAGHAVILPKSQSYTLYGNKSGMFPVINFDCIQNFCDTITVYKLQNNDVFIKYFGQLKELMIFENNTAKIMSIFYSILHNLYLQTCTVSPALREAMLCIEKNISNPKLNNAMIAAHCNISEVYFRKLFFEIYGMPPHKYILDTRIVRAKQLLSEGIFKINSVSEECGFTNQYHFSRIFKQKTGLTPTEYMKKYKITAI